LRKEFIKLVSAGDDRARKDRLRTGGRFCMTETSMKTQGKRGRIYVPTISPSFGKRIADADRL
jgi:hypothetical protein